MITQSVFSIIVGVVALVLVFEMLRRRRLREKYAVLWLVIGVAALVVAAWPRLLNELAAAVGINTPSNLLFFASLGVSFFVALQLSSEVGSLEEESRTLAEEVGMLRMQVAELSRNSQRPPAAQDPGSATDRADVDGDPAPDPNATAAQRPEPRNPPAASQEPLRPTSAAPRLSNATPDNSQEPLRSTPAAQRPDPRNPPAASQEPLRPTPAAQRLGNATPDNSQEPLRPAPPHSHQHVEDSGHSR